MEEPTSEYSQCLNLYIKSATIPRQTDIKRYNRSPRDTEVGGRGGHTLLHKLGPLDPPLYLLLVPHPAVRHEGLVQARAEVGEAEGVLAAEEEELWRAVSNRAFPSWGNWMVERDEIMSG